MSRTRRVRAARLTVVLLLTNGVYVTADEDFEAAPTFRASTLLTGQQLRSQTHEVDDVVHNDGMLNRYLIKTPYGAVDAGSTAELNVRIHEMQVVAVLDGMRKTDLFARAVKEGTKKAVTGAAELVRNPIGTVNATVSGVTKMFRRAGNSLFSRSPADGDDGRLKAATGFTRTKRQFAKELNVDPYSENEILQQYLDEMSWSAFAGGISTAAAFSAVPGAAGTATAITRTSATGVSADLARAPLDLEKQNRESLANMGVSEDIRELFLHNDAYPPSLETWITNSLVQLKGVANRDAFVKVALLTDQRDVAAYRQRQIEMYAGYHNKVSTLMHFLPVRGGSTVVAENTAGEIVLAAPVDYLAWTPDIGRAFIAENYRSTLAGKKKQLWLTGQVSPRAFDKLTALGWSIYQNAGSKVGGL